MFRDGQYLEVIKASDNCLATAVVTVEEKIVDFKKKKVSTNKWLDLEDWAALYKILERAILRNVRTERSREEFETCKWKKSTRQLEVTYMFEPSECLKDVTSLPTIRVNVSPARRKSEKPEYLERTSKKEKGKTHHRPCEKTRSVTPDQIHEKDTTILSERRTKSCDVVKRKSGSSKKDKTRRYLQSEDSKSTVLEEYVPDVPTAKKLCADLKYVPSRKSILEGVQISSNEYTPTVSDNTSAVETAQYVPNFVRPARTSHEIYEPRPTTVSFEISEEYIPNSKGIKASVEEYQPGFTSKSMKFDDSYVPSSVRYINENS